MFCKNCNLHHPEALNFCPNCGEKLSPDIPEVNSTPQSEYVPSNDQPFTHPTPVPQLYPPQSTPYSDQNTVPQNQGYVNQNPNPNYNTQNYNTPPMYNTPPKKKSSVGLIVGICVGILTLCLAAGLLILWVSFQLFQSEQQHPSDFFEASSGVYHGTLELSNLDDPDIAQSPLASYTTNGVLDITLNVDNEQEQVELKFADITIPMAIEYYEIESYSDIEDIMYTYTGLYQDEMISIDLLIYDSYDFELFGNGLISSAAGDIEIYADLVQTDDDPDPLTTTIPPDLLQFIHNKSIDSFNGDTSQISHPLSTTNIN